MATRTAVLMYHELVAGRRGLCRDDAGYTRYCIPATRFTAQLEWLHARGFRGLNVSQLLGLEANGRGVGITFDDGCETDLLYAAPRLLEARCDATFFVVTGWIGQRGYLSRLQLRELRALGFEIGSHSRTHAYLPDLDRVSLQDEIARSKDELEQWLGESIQHLSCPGGRWSRVVSEVARDAGYTSVSTSRPGLVTHDADRFCLPRTAILDETDALEFARICRGDRQWLRAAKTALLAGAKRAVGNSAYENVRRVLLDG